MAAAVRKMRNSTGTRAPSMTIKATAKAVSVDIGTPQPCDHGPCGNDQKVQQGRRDHAAERGGDRQRRRAPAGEAPDREFALDLEAHHQEEDRQQPVVDPVQSDMPKRSVRRTRIRAAAPRTPRTPVPAANWRARRRRSSRAAAARRRTAPSSRSPAPPSGRGGRASRASRRRSALVPRPVVAAAVDEERRRDEHAARARARFVRVDPRPGAPPASMSGESPSCATPRSCATARDRPRSAPPSASSA